MSNERPILFSAPMVRALLAGAKTQTRRALKFNDSGHVVKGGRKWHPDDPAVLIACPYGHVGDMLWVRETAAFAEFSGGLRLVNYRATPDGDPTGVTWRPSIHMPRWASRISLRITNIRVERLQSISEEDAKAEGVKVRDIVYPDEPRSAYSYVEQYRLLWDSINGAGSWQKNPLVWAITFERLPLSEE